MKAKLSELLANGSLSAEALAEVMSLLPDDLLHEEVITRRLALPRSFTAELYALAVADLDGPPSFEEFSSRAEVDPVLGDLGRFAVRNGPRNVALSTYWPSRPEEREEWVKKFGAALDPQNEIEVQDRLQLLFLGDQSVARGELRKAYDQADGADNLAAAAALVELVAGAIRQFGDQASKELHREFKARQQARNLFYAEFYQTKAYFTRTAMEAELETFLSAPADAPWIFHLYAAGGMGKTTFLRHLIAHDCVRRGMQIPCAWLDFDFLEVSTVVRAPWLLYLPMAAQWNEQLVQPVFGGVLDASAAKYADLLFRTQTDGSATGLENAQAGQAARTQYLAGRSNPMRCGILANAVPVSEEARQDMLSSARQSVEFLEQKFTEAMSNLPTDRPMLLFMDTLELASQSMGGELLEVLQMLRKLHARTRETARQQGRPPVNFKVILSGRYELGVEHVPRFGTEFGGDVEKARLEGLSDAEAHAFLLDALPEASRSLAPAMVKKARGIPFHLALFAEWAKADPALTAKTVEETEEVSAAMLIERIVKRISSQPLRWIVRYGIVPRTLSLEFLRNVMREPLIQALSGEARLAGVDTVDSSLERDVWRPEQNFQFDADQLWNQELLPYVSAQGWLMPEGKAATQVRFRPDILQAMRQLLRSQPIFGELHRRALAWYEEQSLKNPNDPATLFELIYHARELDRLQPDQSGTVATILRKTFERSELLPASRQFIANALRGEDFPDFTPAEAAYIEFQYADATAEVAGYRYLTPETDRALRRAFNLAEEAGRTDLFPHYATLWKLVLDRAPVSMLLGAYGRLPADDQIVVTLIISEMSGEASPLALDVLRPMLGYYSKGERRKVPRAVVEERVARHLQQQRPDEATAHYEAAAADCERRQDLPGSGRLLRLASANELTLGRLSRAEQILSVALSGAYRTPGVVLQAARLELAKGEPGQALARLQILAQAQLGTREKLEARCLEAEAFSQRMLWQEASDSWRDVEAQAHRISNANALRRCAFGQIKLDRWWLRRTDLSQARPGTPDSSRSRDTRWVDELDVWQIIHAPNVEAATQRVAGELGGNSPSGKIRLLLALSQFTTLPERRWKEMLELAGQLPRSARFVALVEPVLLGSPPTLPEDFKRRLAELMAYEPEGPVESAWYGVRHGEFLAWLGFHEEAAALLRALVPRPRLPATGWQAATYRERRRIEQRLRAWSASSVPPEPDPADFWLSIWPHTPFRAAAASLENAQCAVAARDFPLVREILRLVQPGLDGCLIPTDFHLLAKELRGTLEAIAAERKTTMAFVDLLNAKVPDPAPTGASSELPSHVSPSLPYVFVSLRPQSGRILSSVSGRVHRQDSIGAVSSTMEILLRARNIPRRLTKLSLDELAQDFTELLEDAGVPLSAEERVGLRFPSGPFSAAPWELAFRQSRKMVWRAPSSSPGPESGDFEAAYREAWESGRGDAGADTRAMQPVVWLPISSRDQESTGAEAYWRLREAATVIETPEEYRRFGRHDSAILHVAGSFSETTGLGEPMISAHQLSAFYFARAFSGRESRPTIFLDVPPVHDSAELMHQLLLRNYFAQLLLDSGLVHCVVATGLMQAASIPEFHALLLEAQRQPWMTQAELLDRLVQLSRATQQPSLHALFTRDDQGILKADLRA